MKVAALVKPVPDRKMAAKRSCAVMSQTLTPTVYVIAGPNGAGKTTFARRYLPQFADCREFVNADLIAAGLSPSNPESQAGAAGRLMLDRIGELSAARASFGFETTLAGRVYARRLRALKLISDIEFPCSSSGFHRLSWPLLV